MDVLSSEQRSTLMRSIRSKDSALELRLRSALWRAGLRYRKHYRKAPGTPDVAFVGKKVAVFCDSEFWHGYDWAHRKDDFKSNRDFWHAKIERNMERDRRVDEQLQSEGWLVLRLWGRQIERDVESCVASVREALASREDR